MGEVNKCFVWLLSRLLVMILTQRSMLLSLLYSCIVHSINLLYVTCPFSSCESCFVSVSLDKKGCTRYKVTLCFIIIHSSLTTATSYPSMHYVLWESLVLNYIFSYPCQPLLVYSSDFMRLFRKRLFYTILSKAVPTADFKKAWNSLIWK